MIIQASKKLANGCRYCILRNWAFRLAYIYWSARVGSTMEVLIFLILALAKRRRPSRYKGIGVRGGVVLAALWAPLCGVAALLGSNVWWISFCVLAGLCVGYSLERVSGAIAVGIYSGLLAGFAMLDREVPPWGWAIVGAGVGILLGLKSIEK